ncbi:hypothetical protein QFZ28_001726 [Neobacillus niacini]|uniref:hypothetical protein n=1 Tax=Neobacillus niacini TaxID=86668 RepID=UPI0027883E34|nr:hypothetical protein [Neobacillus niacini]MDQ1001326.1 hypothetical protein [Neobacillus niacini]
MQTIIWAFGAMLLLLLIVSFLPLNFNLKGKFTVVLSAFFIALGGLAAVTLFPIWQTLLILLVLTFFTSYVLDSRLGNALYSAFVTEEDFSDDKNEIHFSKTEKKSEFDSLELDELDTVIPSTIKISASLSPSEPETIESLDDSLEVPFLLQDSKSDQIDDEETDELPITDGYLADIENLLLEETGNVVEPAEDDWLSELTDLEEMEAKENKNKEENQLDDGELEILFAFKEAAAGNNDPLENESSHKKVVLE